MFATPLLALALGVASAAEVPEPLPEGETSTAAAPARWTPEKRYRLGMGLAFAGLGAIGAGTVVGMTGSAMLGGPSPQVGNDVAAVGGTLYLAAAPLMSVGSLAAAYASGGSGLWGVSSLVLLGAGAGSLVVAYPTEDPGYIMLGAVLLCGAYAAAGAQMVNNTRRHRGERRRLPALWTDPRHKTFGLSGRV